MEKESATIGMALNFKDNGFMITIMVREFFILILEKFNMENGDQETFKELVFMKMKWDSSMREISNMGLNQDGELSIKMIKYTLKVNGDSV